MANLDAVVPQDGAPGIDSNRRLGLYGQKAGGFASTIATKMAAENPLGLKGIAANGQVVVGQEFNGDPVALGKPAQGG
ncbi:hypothetical protein [Rhodococcus sp. NPDC049939]|uniref:hypothetical protein n=1 Tax=Rhodococcus sp. NPDC049939 TaxID=3155511 RepID=UPI0033EA1C11